MEQRVNIKFCYKLGKTATETHEMLVQVYRTEAMSIKCIYDWFKCFHDGKETTEDEPRSGQPLTSRAPDMIERVRQMLAQDQRVTLRLMAEELGFSKDTVHTIVREDLGKRRICSWFVPHKLTDEQKVKQMETNGDFITMCDQDPSFLRTIFTRDETWCFQFDPESKRQSMEWSSPSSPRPK
jgi:transposase